MDRKADKIRRLANHPNTPEAERRAAIAQLERMNEPLVETYKPLETQQRLRVRLSSLPVPSSLIVFGNISDSATIIDNVQYIAVTTQDGTNHFFLFGLYRTNQQPIPPSRISRIQGDVGDLTRAVYCTDTGDYELGTILRSPALDASFLYQLVHRLKEQNGYTLEDIDIPEAWQAVYRAAPEPMPQQAAPTRKSLRDRLLDTYLVVSNAVFRQRVVATLREQIRYRTH